YYVPRWVFIPRRYFLATRVYAYAAPPSRNYVFVRQTVNVTNYVTVNRVVVNRSIEPRRIEAAIGRPVRPLHVNVVSDPRPVGPARGTQVNVFRPTVRITQAATPPATALATPRDRPRVAIHRDAVAPSERRVQREGTHAPGAPQPGAKPGEGPKPPTAAQPPV